MPSPLHSKQTVVDGIHTSISYEYANATARLAATGFTAEDVGKFARQLDNNSLWMLSTTTPTWLGFLAAYNVLHRAITVGEATTGTITLTTVEEANDALEITGALSQTLNVIVSTVANQWTIDNRTTGGFSIILKTSAGAGVTILAGNSLIAYCNGTNVESSMTIGPGAQPLNANLTSISALGTAADKVMYSTGGATWAETASTAAGRSMMGAADAAAQRTLLSVNNVDNTSDVNKPVSTAQASADTAATNAAKAYADGLVVGLWDDRGVYDASVNTFPAAGGSGTAGAILKGDIWTISVAGTLGGVAVKIGDTVRALIDTPGQTASNWSILEVGMGYVPANVANPLSQFAATTSAQLAGVISDETGSAGGGVLVFSNSPVFTTPNIGSATGSVSGTASGLSATLVATSGGTGQSTYTVGDLLVGDATNTLAKLADVATGSVLISGGVGVAPSWSSTPTFTGTNISGTAASFTAGNVTTNANLTGGVTSVGNAATVVTNANLTGDVTSVGNATTITNAPVIAKVLTGYTKGSGTVAATDTILQAFQKLDGNDDLKAPLISPSFTTPSLGVATAISINGNILTTGSSTYTGTAGQTYTFPTTTATLARTDAAQSFSGLQTFRAVTDTATLGTELTTNGSFTGSATGWTLNAGWAYGTDNVVWTVGATTSLTQDFAVTNGALYLISWGDTRSIASNGSIKAKLGAVSVPVNNWPDTSLHTNSVALIAGTTGTVTLALEGASVVGGGTITIDNVSCKLITNTPASINIKNVAGTVSMEGRVTNTASNLFLGNNAGWSLTTGTNNTFLGGNAGYCNTTGYSNVFVGTSAGAYNTTGYQNVFIGLQAGLNNSSGYNNLFFGQQAGTTNSTGYGNCFIGPLAGQLNTTGINNTSIGNSAGTLGTFGNYNTNIGAASGYSLTTGSTNTCIGYNTGLNITTGSGNTVLGANVTGLAAGLTNNIILANGAGTIKGQHDGTNWTFTGNVKSTAAFSFSNILSSVTAPTVASGFGTTPTITANGTATFRINVGTGGIATGGVLTMPAATNGWNATCRVFNPGATDCLQQTFQTANTTNSITLTNLLLSTGAATAWPASTILIIHAVAY